MENEHKYFDLYQNYQGVKLHFSSGEYDFFKYSGKVKTKKKLTEPQKYIFKRLAKNFDKNLVIVYFAIRFYENPKFWIFRESADAIIKDIVNMQSYIEILDYNIKQEITKMIDAGTENNREPNSVKDLLFFKDGYSDLPYLYRKFASGSVSLFMLISLDDAFSLLKNWSKYMKDDLIFKEKVVTFRKVKQFLRLYIKEDKNKCRAIVKNLIM